MNRHGDPEQGYDHEYAMKYTVSDDVMDRAREAAIKRCMADCYDVPLEKSQLANECKNAALSMIAALTAAGLRIVEADVDDRRTAALEAFTEWWHMEQKRLDVIGEVPGASFSHDDLVQWKSSKAAIIGFLTDDSGKTYTTESEG